MLWSLFCEHMLLPSGSGDMAQTLPVEGSPPHGLFIVLERQPIMIMVLGATAHAAVNMETLITDTHYLPVVHGSKERC